MKVDKQLHITILTTSFPVYDGIAVGIHVLEKAKHLQKLGHHITVVAPHHHLALKNELYEGITVHRFSYFWPAQWQKLAYGDGIPTNLKKSFIAKLQLPFFLLSFFIKAWKYAKNADIIHCHWTISGLIGVLISKFRKKPVVLSMHGAEIFVLGRNKILAFVLKNTDLLINNSSFTQSEVLKNYPSTKCIVISPGTDTNRFKSNKKEGLRKDIGMSENDFFILCIGKFIPRKGIEYLINAMNLIVHEKGLNRIKLRIGGRGYLKPKYEAMISKMSLHENIEFLSYIPDNEFPHYFSEADVFVLPAIVDENGDTEGLGVVLIEANACGTPVIASKVGGITDVIIDQYNGYLIEEKNPTILADKIEYLSNNPLEIQKMGENGRKQTLDLFSWEKNAEKIEREYYKFLKE